MSLEESVDRTLGTDASIATSGIAVGSSVYTGNCAFPRPMEFSCVHLHVTAVNDESQVSSPAVASSLDTTVGSDGDIQSTFVSSLHTDSYFGSTVSPVQSMQPGSAAKVGFGGPLVVDAESTAPSRCLENLMFFSLPAPS